MAALLKTYSPIKTQALYTPYDNPVGVTIFLGIIQSCSWSSQLHRQTAR